MSPCPATQNLHHHFVTTKRRKLVAIALFAVISGLVAYRVLNRNHEPEYEGRYLSDWLEQYSAPSDDPYGVDKKDAAAAVREIGTNALPYLLKCIAAEPPAWRTSLSGKLPDFITDRPSVADWLDGNVKRRRKDAHWGFAILGPKAVSAVPELLAIIMNSTSREASTAANSAMKSIGEPALPALKAALANPDRADRDQILYIFSSVALTQGTEVGLAIVEEALNDNDVKVRIAATNLLPWHFTVYPTNAPTK